MKVPIKWLKEYVDFSDEKALIDQLTAIGHMQDGPAKEAAGDRVYDLEVRQNRADCLSILGIAREAGAVLNAPIKDPTKNLPEISSIQGETKVSIEDNDCYRFSTVTIENVKIEKSPTWLSEKLAAYGIKSINNIVDITNFVMVELGEPLHAWDTRSVKNQTITVRKAKKGEQVTVIGGKNIILTENDLVAADDKILTIAGIIGAEGSGIKDDTTSIILEDATYNQATIRKTSLRHGLRTESSTRHEKFLHPHLAKVALQRAVSLILELCGGKVVGYTDQYPDRKNSSQISLDISRFNSVGGVRLAVQEVSNIMKRLHLHVKTTADSQLGVEIPYFRTDLVIEDDLIEEVLRIHGYDNIPAHLPISSPPTNIDSRAFLLQEELRNLFVASGYDEQITEPLTREEKPRLEPILLQNSLNEEKTMLRTTLKNSLHQALLNQKKYRKTEICIFELGKIYFKSSDKYVEQKMIGFITSNVDYFSLKGIIELIKERFETAPDIDNSIIELIEDKTYFVEIPLQTVISLKTIEPYSEAPHTVLEDLSFFVSVDTKIGELMDQIKKTSQLLNKIYLGEDPKITDEKKSVFLKLEFSTSKGNLTKNEVEPEKKKIITLLENVYYAKIR